MSVIARCFGKFKFHVPCKEPWHNPSHRPPQFAAPPHPTSHGGGYRTRHHRTTSEAHQQVPPRYYVMDDRGRELPAYIMHVREGCDIHSPRLSLATQHRLKTHPVQASGHYYSPRCSEVIIAAQRGAGNIPLSLHIDGFESITEFMIFMPKGRDPLATHMAMLYRWSWLS